jgi:type II secretory ATPase GspE/PulE/Tfp pilus assembly ATPase PilB-like protein
VTGPTGSGKTTTLYALLQELVGTQRHIITLEDPVEYEIQGIVQSEIDPDHGYTFASGLRSILRHDPNVIHVGEIRDLETAQTAIDAALTGHLVLSTLHTNSALEAIPRLLSMGVSPYTFAPALRGVMAQRLVRTISDQAKTSGQPINPAFPAAR